MALKRKASGFIKRPTGCLQRPLSTVIQDDHSKRFPWMSSFPETVQITDVGPRDGLQNESSDHIISTEVKLKLIDKLKCAGLRKIECGSFVSPKWVPQMANSAEVFQRLNADSNAGDGTIYVGLVMNQKGIERAVETKVEEVLYVLSPSEEFTSRNMNCSVKESYDRMSIIARYAIDHGVRFRVVISTALGCPYEGHMEPSKVTAILSKMSSDYTKKEIENVIIADTIGVGTAGSTYRLFDHLMERDCGFPFGVHFHDTFGQALSNIVTSMAMGIDIIESSVGGLGGCPYALGATGNVATEDVVYMLHGMGIETGIGLDKLTEASNYITDHLGKDMASSVTRALNAKKARSANST